MGQVTFNSVAQLTALRAGWQLARTAPGAVADPSQLEAAGLRWVSAAVPGTALQALAAAKEVELDAPPLLDDVDVWYRCEFDWAGGPAAALRLDGLATLADVWLNGQHLLRSENMFHSHRLGVGGLRARNQLAIRFSSLTAHLVGKKGRARWRPKLVQPPTLRWVRTTQLGRISGWCPPLQPVGPWREVALEEGPLQVDELSLLSGLDGDTGVVRAALTLSGPAAQGAVPVQLQVGDCSATLARTAAGRFEGAVRVPEARRWWPHTHGTPALYPVGATVGDARLGFGHTGFRTLALGRDGGDFALSVNGERVFCRGAVWTAADLAGLPGSREAYLPLLTLARDGGMNMLRVSGVGVYESPEFHALCDELGLLVWQDFMFARLDYPVADAAFRASVEREARGFLSARQLSPSLAVLCGGSETEQQPAMMGLPPETFGSPLTDAWLPAASASLRPDVPYVSSSPTGGPLPFVADVGATHYYGVGAYRRPLDDARRANVRFASECLGFAHLPDEHEARRVVGHDSVLRHPEWQARVARDPGASWDFVDVRDHYLRLLYGVDPTALRSDDPEAYLRLSAEVSGEVMGEVFAEWRRAHSSCRGGLVWFFSDLWPGEGWGVVDSAAHPKPAWHHLARAFKPRAVFLTDEGVNGLAVHLHNESAAPLTGSLELQLLRGGRVSVAQVSHPVTLAAHQSSQRSAFELLPGFLDVSYAYRFGPPSHQLTVATLRDQTGAVLSEAFHFPTGRASGPTGPVALETALVRQADASWLLTLTADVFVQSVRVRDERFIADDGGFHLLPGRARTVRLAPRVPSEASAPDGDVMAVTLAAPVRYRGGA